MKRIVVVLVMALVVFVFISHGGRNAFATESQIDLFSGDSVIVAQSLNKFQEDGTLLSHFRCDANKVLVLRYVAVNYTLLVLENNATKNALFLFTDEKEAYAGGNSKHYFKRLQETIGAIKIDETKFVESLMEMSLNFYISIANQQRLLSDLSNTARNELFKNDCSAVDIAQK